MNGAEASPHTPKGRVLQQMERRMALAMAAHQFIIGAPIDVFVRFTSDYAPV